MADNTFTKELLETEVWKSIPNYEGYYEVSNFGCVRSIKRGIILKPAMRHNYLSVHLSKRNKRKTFNIHKLVASVFIGDCPPKYTVNHIDLNKLNNRSTNLEYITQKQNIEHAQKFGRMRKGSQVHAAKITEKEVVLVHVFSKFGVTQNEIAEYFSLCRTTVGDILRGKNWKHVSEIPDPELKPVGNNEFEFELFGEKYYLRER